MLVDIGKPTLPEFHHLILDYLSLELHFLLSLLFEGFNFPLQLQYFKIERVYAWQQTFGGI
jgi:hypothetical protein